MRSDLFLHFLNRDAREVQNLNDGIDRRSQIRVIIQALTAAAILCEEKCIIPPGFGMEDDIAFSALESRKGYLQSGLIELALRESSVTALVEKKRSEYRYVRGEFGGLFDDQRVSFLAASATALVRRRANIGDRVVGKWEAGPDEEIALWEPLKRREAWALIKKLVDVPRKIIQRGDALTWIGVKAFEPSLPRDLADQVRRLLQHNYFSLYTGEFGLQVLRKLPWLPEDFELPSNSASLRFDWLSATLTLLGVPWLLDADDMTVLALRAHHDFIRFLDAYDVLCRACRDKTDLRFHLGAITETIEFDWRRFGLFWREALLKSPDGVGNQRLLLEFANATGELAARLEARIGFSNRGMLLRRLPLIQASDLASGDETNSVLGGSKGVGCDDVTYLASLRSRMGSAGRDVMPTIDILIATALTEENQVVRAVLDVLATRMGKIRNTTLWSYNASKDVRYVIAARSAHTQGSISMAVATKTWLDRLMPRAAVLVGIAAAVKVKGIALGYVPFANEVLGYGDIAVHKGKLSFRNAGFTVDPKLQWAAGELGSEAGLYQAWQSECKATIVQIIPTLNALRHIQIVEQGEVHSPHLIVGITGSGPFLLRDADFRRKLVDLPDDIPGTEIRGVSVSAPIHPKLVSTEMEAHGFMHACKECETPASVLKGISDFGDGEKNKLEEESGGFFRAYACSNAVVCLLHMLRQHPRK